MKEQTGKSENALKKSIKVEIDPQDASRFRTACQGDDALWKRVQPLAGFVRLDNFGYPVVIPTGSVFVTAGTDRRSSGTHYTPRSLTEPIVQYTLEPLVYVGPAEGLPKSEWKLKSAAELLALKICDMACGSGAFLVQAARYMAERLLEAWEAARQANPDTIGITPEGTPSTGKANETLIPVDPDERKTYAMRIIAQRCLYGVDINPLAVEMAKLSLWLLTLAKDKPFEFLDHSIRCGDSLVGLHDLEQLRHFSLKPDADDAVLFGGPLDEAVDEAISLRLKLEDLPANTVEDIQRQETLLIEATEKIARLRCAADLLVSAEFWGGNAKDKQERVRHAAVVSGHYIEHGPTEEFEQTAVKERRGQKMFHWPLEFPEVIVKRGGFDAFVGNPPFMGGQKITGILGDAYRSLIVSCIANGSRGSADLCAYFALRGSSLLAERGLLGLLATNTIAQGGTREVGLGQILAEGFTIPFAVSSRPWPGVAILEVSHVWLYRGLWKGPFLLNGHECSGISSYLIAEGGHIGEPQHLATNANQAFQGAIVLGMGFVLTPEEANILLLKNKRNKDVLFPLLNGSDLNSRPDQDASRWVINFCDWPLDRTNAPDGYDGPVAADYLDCLDIVRSLVQPEREKLRDTADGIRRKKFWWHYGRVQRSLTTMLDGMAETLVCSEVTKHLAFCFVPTGTVFSANLDVIPTTSRALFATLQSTIHDSWARTYSSNLRVDLKYSPGNAFETFPFPVMSENINDMGSLYHDLRHRMMVDRNDGLTQTYNRFHDPDETSAASRKLRELHVEIDQAVATAYGWTDLDLGHGFHETKQGVRFTISEPARREVLQRLLKLNHERYAEEVKQGLHDKKKGGAGRVKGGGKKKSTTQDESGRLFD